MDEPFRRLEELRALAAEGPLTTSQESEMYDLGITGWLCSVDGKQWRPKDAIAEEQLQLQVDARCGGKAVGYCLPGPHDWR